VYQLLSIAPVQVVEYGLGQSKSSASATAGKAQSARAMMLSRITFFLSFLDVAFMVIYPQFLFLFFCSM
jgi:hypothetical protein